jgi:hypothetical protein
VAGSKSRSPFLFYTNTMTLNEIASAIRSNIGNGLKEVANYAYPIDQIKDEIGNVRNQILLEDPQKMVLNPEFFAQRLDNIPLDLVRFPVGGYSASPGLVPHFQIPRLAMTKDDSAIIYLGPPDQSFNIKVYHDYSFKNHKHSRAIGRRPYAYVDLAHDASGYLDGYLFQLGPTGMQFLSTRSIFADPIMILELDGLFGQDEEFPAPSAVQEMIIDRITAKYVQYYKQLNHPYQANTQTDQH